METMPLPQRIAILDMSSPGTGARIDTVLHRGLQRFLKPHLDMTADGRYYLRDSHQRQIVRVRVPRTQAPSSPPRKRA